MKVFGVIILDFRQSLIILSDSFRTSYLIKPFKIPLKSIQIEDSYGSVTISIFNAQGRFPDQSGDRKPDLTIKNRNFYNIIINII